MELVLNLAWVLLAAVMFWLWFRFTPSAGQSRRLQLVALAVLLLILFPVISVTDDLQAIQNPAEADSCLRRDHAVSSAHSIFPTAATLPAPVFAELSLGVVGMAAPGRLPAPIVDHPALAPIQNRPPPVA
jgi:thiol:disulfide interchange protein